MTHLLYPDLLENGFLKKKFHLEEEVRTQVAHENWHNVDEIFKELTSPNGRLFEFLKTFHDFSSIEFIISIRDAQNEWEEDGIWHDDGSRKIAFSLSLTLFPENIQGGILGLRKKNTTLFSKIPTPEFGEIIIFLTGEYGFEHKIHRVEAGKRVIIAGWCS
jgi:hypothetical protein